MAALPDERELVGKQLRELKDVKEQLQSARLEVVRLSTCHICGDCLSVEDGRCEQHAGYDETEADEDDPCGCEWCEDGREKDRTGRKARDDLSIWKVQTVR
jgi:hypothetical protein